MMMFDWINIEIADALTQAIVHSLWMGLLIASLLGIADQTGLVSGAKRKYLFYMSGLVLLSISTLISFVFAFTAPSEIISELIPYSSGIASSTSLNTTTSLSNPMFWQGAVALMWFVGFIVFGLKNVFGFIELYKLRKNAFEAPLHWQRRVKELSRKMHINSRTVILCTRDVSVPFILGIVRPVIMFPASYFVQLTPQQIESIIVHELAHISRNDFLLNLIQTAIESILFYNPAAWWMGKQIRLNREYCCDDRVRNTTSYRKTYMEALYNVARFSSHNPTSMVALFNHKSELIMRMNRMSSSYSPQKNLRTLVTASLGLLIVFGLFAFNTIENKLTDSSTSTSATLSSIDVDLKLDNQLFEGINLELLDIDLDVIDVVKRTSHIEKRRTPPIAKSAIAFDTIPPTDKMRELESEIEAKAEEMEELAEQMEDMMESTIDFQVEKMEALVEEMEEMAEKYEATIEETIENSPELIRLEELSELLEEKMDLLDLETELLNEDAIEAIEEQMEAKAEQYEDYQSLSEEEREKLAAEMQALAKDLQNEMQGFQLAQMKMIEDSDYKQIQKEMIALSLEIAEKQKLVQPMNEDMMRLQIELQMQQSAMGIIMQGVEKEIQEGMQLKAKELQELSLELQKEAQKQQKENDGGN